MNILLLYPEFPDTFWSFKHALKFVRKGASFPPLGLLTIAPMLPAEWSVRLVDLNVEKLVSADLAWADYAFISAMTVQRESARKVIEHCKRVGCKIVAGGPLFTSEYEDFKEIDHLVLNEAEITLPRFLEDLAKGEARPLYQSNEHPEIAAAPVPAWHLLKLHRYASMSVQYSRGCPFNCDFCNVTALLGHKPRVKTADQVIAELEGLRAAGWLEDVFFVDDNFIGNKSRLKRELLPRLIQWRGKRNRIVFHTEASINLADDPELMDRMVEAGFRRVFIGIESTDDSSLAECSKIQNANRDMIADVKRIQRSGLEVQGGFIVGFDNDTASVFQRQIDFIQQSGIVTAMVGLLQAPPGTRLYERLKREGRLRGDVSGDNVDGSTNIIPKMDIQSLKDGYRQVLEHIYAPRHYYERLKTFLREYKVPVGARRRITRRDLGAFMRSVVRLGIIGRERVCYWKLLLWTAVKRPKLFPQAVTLAIYGYHFRKVCKLHVV